MADVEVKNINLQPVATPSYYVAVDADGKAIRANPVVAPVQSVIGLTGAITQGDLRSALGLGGAAYLNTGTTGTTVALGNHTHAPASLGAEPTISAGTTSQYYRGDKTWATFPSFQVPVQYKNAGTNVGFSGAINVINFTGNSVAASVVGTTLTVDINASSGGGGTVTNVSATAPEDGFTISVSNPTTTPNLTFTLADDLAAVEGISTTGWVKRTAADTWSTVSSVSLTADVSGILPIANGGTGTATPGLVQGTNITITGAWPNQTINATTSGGGDMHHCYSEDTKILTKSGWKSFADVTMNDLVATLNPDSGNLEYSSINKLYEYDVDEDLYNVESEQISLLVTKNHKMYVKPRGKDKFSLTEAERIYGKRVTYKKNAKWVGESPEYYLIGEKRVPFKLWLEFLGYYLSEGCTISAVNGKGSKDYLVCVTQVKNNSQDKMFNCVRELATYLGRSAFINGDKNIKISDKTLYEELEHFGKSWEKFIPDYVLSAKPEDIEIFVGAYILGDGHVNFSSRRRVKLQSIFSSSYKMMEGFQELFLKLGCSGNIKIGAVEGDGGSFINGKEIIARRTHYSITLNQKSSTPTINHGHVKSQRGQKEEYIRYKGKVYCVEAAINNVVYVKRNDKPVWCGNSVYDPNDDGKIDYAQTTGFGTSATLNVAVSGNASSAEVVKGNDTRLSDARTPTAHTQAASTISDSTATGRALLTATDAASARTTLGLGTAALSATTDFAPASLSATVSGHTTQLSELYPERELIIAVSDESTALVAGTTKTTIRAPFNMILTKIPRASLNTASSSGLVTVDINVGGTSILGTDKLSIDATEKTSTTAATATTLATTSVTDDAEITIDIDAAGAGAKGLKVTLYYKRSS